ncbi:MAG: hypothetical protein ACJA2O_003538 [Candidatus Azotimanducaceae bacterium]|jgi:hypothetical protein
MSQSMSHRGLVRCKSTLISKLIISMLLFYGTTSLADTTPEPTIPVLLLEAKTAMQAKEFDVAIDHFQHAQYLIHFEEGVYSPSQNQILQQLARIQLEQGSFARANKMMELQHRIIGESSGFSPEAMAPSWRTLGRWYQKTMQPKKSQSAFKEALAIMKEHSLPQSELASVYLSMLKNEYLLVACCDIDYAKSQLEEMDLTVEQWLHFGDLATLAGEYEQARSFYLKSDVTLPATPIGADRIDKMAGGYVDAMLQKRGGNSMLTSAVMTPTQLVGAPLPLCESRIADLAGKIDYTNFNINMNFVVNEQGKVRRLKVTETNAPRLVRNLVRKQLQNMRYRPALSNGEPQLTKLEITQEFDHLATRGPAEQRIAAQLGCVAAARALERDVIVAKVN